MDTLHQGRLVYIGQSAEYQEARRILAGAFFPFVSVELPHAGTIELWTQGGLRFVGLEQIEAFAAGYRATLESAGGRDA